jgi:hypothetical protein
VLGHRQLPGQRNLGRDVAGQLGQHAQVQLQVTGPERGGPGPRVHGQGAGLEPADHEPAPRGPQVHGGVHDADDGLPAVHAGRGLGDQQLVPDRGHGDVSGPGPAPGQLRDLAGAAGSPSASSTPCSRHAAASARTRLIGSSM